MQLREIENVVKGLLEINQLQDMITEIRRHNTTLCNRMEDLEVHMGWSHANANNKYMLLVKDLAVKAIDQGSTARSSDRNIIEDPLFITSQDNLLPDMNMETSICEQGMEILITLIKTLPFSPYPMINYFFFINLLQTKNNIRHRWINGYMRCYNKLFSMLKDSDDEDAQVVTWKKILFLQQILITPFTPGVKWTFASTCEYVMNDNWDEFKIGFFQTRIYFDNGQMEKEMQDKIKIKKSRSLLEMGEISRSYGALDADLESKKTEEELVQLYKDKLGGIID